MFVTLKFGAYKLAAIALKLGWPVATYVLSVAALFTLPCNSSVVQAKTKRNLVGNGHAVTGVKETKLWHAERKYSLLINIATEPAIIR